LSRILIVDDEERIGLLLSDTLVDLGHRAEYVTDGSSAIDRIRKGSFDLVITDLRMEPVDGMALLTSVRRMDTRPDVVVLTAHGSTSSAVAAMKAGALDYLSKPLDLDELSLWVQRWDEQRRTRERVESLQRDLASLVDDELVGDSPPMRRLRLLIDRVAPTETTVLITGESGTGKELVARAIHRASGRAQRPFVATNCAALSETLAESEFFGHERGAFTGAIRQRAGRFELADSGTLFLDEISEVSDAFQAKLLRALEEREIVRVGSADPIKVDVRVVTATNRDLAVRVADGKFREDLFFRLNVFPIHVPPLRERTADIPAIAAYFLRKFRYPLTALAEGVIDRLCAYRWPGNVRELRNVLERATILASGGPITADDLNLSERQPSAVLHPEPPAAELSDGLDGAERQMIERALREAGGNKSRAARALKITRRVLYARLRKHGLE